MGHHIHQDFVMGNVQHTITMEDRTMLLMISHRSNGELFGRLDDRVVIHSHLEVRIDIGLVHDNVCLIHDRLIQILVNLIGQLSVLRAGEYHGLE